MSISRKGSSENNGENKKGNVYHRAVYDSKKSETPLMYTN